MIKVGVLAASGQREEEKKSSSRPSVGYIFCYSSLRDDPLTLRRSEGRFIIFVAYRLQHVS